MQAAKYGANGRGNLAKKGVSGAGTERAGIGRLDR